MILLAEINQDEHNYMVWSPDTADMILIRKYWKRIDKEDFIKLHKQDFQNLMSTALDKLTELDMGKWKRIFKK